MVIACSYPLNLARSVDRWLRLLLHDGLSRYWRFDLHLYRRDPGKGRTAAKAESRVIRVRFTARLAQRHSTNPLPSGKLPFLTVAMREMTYEMAQRT